MNTEQFNEVLAKLDGVLKTMQDIYEVLLELVPSAEVVEEDGSSSSL